MKQNTYHSEFPYQNRYQAALLQKVDRNIQNRSLFGRKSLYYCISNLRKVLKNLKIYFQNYYLKTMNNLRSCRKRYYFLCVIFN